MSKLARLGLLLLLVLSCLSFVACGKKDGAAPTPAPSADAEPSKKVARGGSDWGDIPIYPGSK